MNFYSNHFSVYSTTLIQYITLLQRVGWWSPTVIRGDDREAVHIPNHKFTVSVVRNLSQKTHWRIKTHLAISHLDVNKINVRINSSFQRFSFRCESWYFCFDSFYS